MSSTRNASRTTSNSKTTSLNTHHTNGSSNSYDINDSTASLNYPIGNNPEFDPNLQRPSLMRNVSQYDGIYRNARFIHAISSGLVGQQVVIQTSDHERFHGVLETLSPNADIILTVSHRLDNNNNDILTSPTLPIDMIDTIDSSSQTFELHKRIIKASNIVEVIAIDIDLSGSAKCSLDENPKVTQLEDDRFSRMEHFYGSDDIDPETLEDLDLGDDGKAGFDPEDMFHTNREKFNTTTDFDETKYTNVPVRQMSAAELLEIEKKVQEIERGTRKEDVDEDDAGVKRPFESHNLDDGNSNAKTNNRSNRNDFRYDTEYNPSKRDNWREQRPTGMNNNRRGGGNNSKQNQYSSTNNRQQYNTRISRNNRFTDNRSPHEGRESPLQQTNEESARNQRLNSGNFSQGQTSGPTSPSTTVPARTIYPSANRPSANRNSPAPYAGSSSSRNNSIPTTSPPLPHQQSGTNKMAKKPSLNEQQSINDEPDQPKQQRSSNNQSNTATLNRPSQLQSKQQLSSTYNNVATPLILPNQDDNSSSHDPTNTNRSQTPGTTTPNSMKSNGGLNPEADEFVPVFPRESSSRPESRDASTASSISMNAFISHAHPQALHLLQQQQQQQQQQMQSQQTSATHAQNAAALYQQYYQPSFANMPHFINAAPQQMTVGVMGTPMIPSQQMIGTGPSTNNSNNGSSSGMTTPNSSVSAGPTYKTNNNNNNNNNQGHSGDNANSGVNNAAPKKAVVSVQRSEQSNVPQQQQQQQMPGAQQMVYSGPHQIRYYSPDYFTQQGGTSTPMQLQQIPFYYHPMNAQGLIQAAPSVGQPQNIMISPASSLGGPSTSGLPPLHYTGVYADPRMYSLYSSAAVNQASINPNWQLARSPPQQQQPTEQQRGYGNGQNVASQQAPSAGASNIGGRSASTSSQPGAGPALTPQYTLNGTLPTGYAYGTPTGWISGPHQVPSPQGNIPSQSNAAYSVMFDPSQQGPPQQQAYVHSNSYETPAYFSQQSQQQPPSQQNLDPVPQGNYNR